ncbi:CRISPR-associated protein Cas7 [Chitinophaga oryzae]|uniref:CRISPR-associated protein Cas7 n=2 Tax=Chitinophaga oryzae TaxID=2725414 RepID=A0AAE6ZF82_9BACT|nr:CRISPR-associated protein Cas7 [Chitinophaga oryzae]
MHTPFIYLRGLRHVSHSVFAVNEGQKYYYDPQTRKRMAYSSGQQIKRSILEGLNMPFAAITFNWEIDKEKKKANQKEPHSPCDPTYADQLLGGYMKAGANIMAVKRRSPLSISSMRPLNPLLGGIASPTENISFDRTSHTGSHKVKVHWTAGKERGPELSEEELDEWLTSNMRTLPNRAFIQDQTRASGLFVYDMAIDLRTLFCVSTNKYEPELYPEIEAKLRDEGWKEGKNIFGNCLVCPKERREEIIPALAKAIINWRITTNQSRTFDPMGIVAIVISDNANQITYAIRGDLRDDMEKRLATPVIDLSAKADFFVTPTAGSYVPGAIGSADALEKAEEKLVKLMAAYPYD